jgi:Fe-S cluster assembly protein SufD
MPSSTEEIWRYSRIDRVELAAYRVGASPQGSAPGATAARADAEVMAAVPEGITPAAVVTTRNGTITGIEVSPSAAAAGLRVSGGAGADVALLEPPAADGGCPIVDLAVALAPDVVCVDVRAGAAIDGPVVVVHRIDEGGAMSAARLSIRAGRSAEVGVVERWTSDDVDALVLSASRIEVGDGAHVRFVTVQELGREVVAIAHQELSTARDASLRTMAVALGGSYARLRTDATITGPGGSNELLAVYFGDGDQMHDFRTLQHHVAPRTTSDLVFKGGVQDRSASVYSGLIKIGKDARHTIANQTNRNLLLSDDAQAESVPNLEIENNDVKCSHASAVGPIDEDHRYYLESRGVPLDVAQRLIVQGFFADLLAKVPVAGLAPSLIAATTAKFHAQEPR